MKRNLNVKRVGKFIENTIIMDAYYNDIRKYKQMTREEEKKFFDRFKNGDVKAREEIIKSNLRFVVSVAKKYVRNDEDLPDLINEGNIGIMEAIDNFDPERGHKFITFAVHYIEKRIRDYQLNQPMISQSNMHKTYYHLSKIRNDFSQKEMREPTNEELIEILKNKYNVEIFNEKDVYNLSINSLDKGELDENDNINYEFDDKYYHENDIENDIKKEDEKYCVIKLMSILPNIEYMIIKFYYGIDIDKEYTIMELSEITGYTQERIRQIIESSKELMINYNKSKKIV